jgi:hypothetical protein
MKTSDQKAKDTKAVDKIRELMPDEVAEVAGGAMNPTLPWRLYPTPPSPSNVLLPPA